MEPLPAETRIGRVALRVTDLETVSTFYTSVIGLEQIQHSDGTGVLGVDGDALLVLQEDSDAPVRTGDGARLYHAAFRVPSREALGGVLTRVEEQDLLDGASDHGVSEALYLTDPEGNGIEVYRDLPRERWPRDGEGGLRMRSAVLDRDPLRDVAQHTGSVPAGTTVGHIHLEAISLADSRRFYSDTLGLTVSMATDHALFLAAGDYHHHIGLNTWNSRTHPARGRGLDWFELVVPEDGIPEVEERMEARYSTEKQDNGFTVTDPNGITLRIGPGTGEDRFQG